MSQAEYLIGDVAVEARVYDFEILKDRVTSKSIRFFSEGGACPDSSLPRQTYLVFLHKTHGRVDTRERELYEAWWCDTLDESEANALSSSQRE